ncbi:hypothetical protein CERZMDRAFT_93120 [Cercospora zeae-maydis SCOH1-5]|uniref:Uncharacterized protein n=1 Tax=Cercospora zeae-maydis SCOH1-5 TaxID=717836 RepID=A0A6A6FV05_9PEZI|nr:hypothetical protein CERZMDRAFT_93120 [Cercospora zeae-maydis SCOH1-5]
MTSIAASARAAHLDTASGALIASSPAISAYLQTQRTRVATTSSNSASKFQACLSCGTLLIAGWNANPIRPSKRTRQDRLNKNASTARKIKCSTCSTIQDTHVKVSKSNPIESTKSTSYPVAHAKPQREPSALSRQPAQISPAPAASEPAAPPSTNTPAEESKQSSSKKRSRNKKSTNDLQAMLANRKAASTASSKGFGLGLGDFIK